MATRLKDFYYAEFPVEIKRENILRLQKALQAYELRDSHVQALQSPLVGVYRMYFHPRDQRLIFDEFGYDINHLNKRLAANRLKDPNMLVVSDPYNQFTIWLAHRARVSTILTENDKITMQMILFKLLQYKFFTSRVNRLFPLGANEAIMQRAIESLSGKYDIRDPNTPTWQLVIEKRSSDILEPRSIHRAALDNFTPDHSVFYVLSDIQTRIRGKLKLIKNAYNETKARGESMGSYSHEEEIDGKKSLKDVKSTYEEMILGVSRDVLIVDKFLDATTIALVTRLVKNLRPDMFRQFLVKVSDIAVLQYKDGKQNVVKERNGIKYYLGYSVLLKACIETTYRVLIQTPGFDIRNRVAIIQKTINQYRASRVNDVETGYVKESVMELVKETGLSSRAETMGALRLAFIAYIILLSFRYK